MSRNGLTLKCIVITHALHAQEQTDELSLVQTTIATPSQHGPLRLVELNLRILDHEFRTVGAVYARAVIIWAARLGLPVRQSVEGAPVLLGHRDDVISASITNLGPASESDAHIDFPHRSDIL